MGGRRAFFGGAGVVAVAMAMMAGSADAQSTRDVPYWASLARGDARMRVGPSVNYPASWVYRRRDLPVRVLEVYSSWRKVEDPDGTQGWMHVSLLKSERTAIVKPDGLADMRETPAPSGRLLFRLEPGVVGRVSGCSNGWCGFDVRGQRGYVAARNLWGAVN